MPYYIILKKHEALNRGDLLDHISTCGIEPIATAAEAHTALKTCPDPAAFMVRFVPTDTERNEWRLREDHRFTDGTYIHVPWMSERYSWPDDVFSTIQTHYAHLSTSHPGLIAYTPSDEYGVQDRQIRTKPGRYLQQFCGHFLTNEQIADYAAKCSAEHIGLKIATTADDIERVYIGGPHSCMSHRPSSESFRGHCHPTRVYGDSDLAIAYTGDIDSASARAIVWQDKHLYGRTYGHCTLIEKLLSDAGFSYGSMVGAKIRAIEDENDNDRWIMPYIDRVSSAEYLGNGWIRLGNGDLCVENTDGVSQKYNEDDEDDEPDTARHCDRCNRLYNTDDRDATDEYCRRCEEDRGYCDYCHNDTWDYILDADGDILCDNCQTSLTCADEHCDHEWIEEAVFTSAQHETRASTHVDDLCQSCAEHYQYCDRCDVSFDVREETTCPDCKITTRRCDKTGDLFETTLTLATQTESPF